MVSDFFEFPEPEPEPKATHRRAQPPWMSAPRGSLPGVIAESWYGFVVSAKTPPAIVKRLQDALAAAQADPAYRENLAHQGASAGELGPEPFASLIKTDAAKWHAIVTAASRIMAGPPEPAADGKPADPKARRRSA